MFASGTMLAYALNAFLPIAAFPASEAPHWRIGARVYLGFALLALVLFVVLWVGFRREDKGKEKKGRAEEEEEARRVEGYPR
jgi:TRAP-type C4-dicarboxylate transport system permease small subunit